MKYFIILSILCIFLLFGCTEPDNNVPIVGNDKDSHGCIGSAGYSWCELKQKCIRIWEEDCVGIITSNTNSPKLATCADPNKKLVIIDTNIGQTWECVFSPYE